jgi:hypothetical protein
MIIFMSERKLHKLIKEAVQLQFDILYPLLIPGIRKIVDERIRDKTL